MATPDQILAASRYRAGGGALFTSSKCPPGPGLENSCQLPFGFIYTPLSPPDNIQVVPIHDENLPPVICLTCLSYLNLYCDVDETTGVWTCALCGCKNAAPPESFHNGTLSPILISPIVEFRQPIAEAHDRVNTISVVVVMDANLPRAEAQAVGSALQAILPEMADAKTRINLGFIVFSKHVSIYQLNSTGVASADIFSTHEGLTEKHLESRQYLTEIGQDGSLECMWRCLSAVYGVVLDNEEGSEINVSKGKQLSRLEQLKQRKETRMRKELERDDDDPDVVVKSPWVLAKENSASRHPLRCTGEAIQCAIDLVASPSNVDLIESRILVFTNGCPNYGDGSVVYDDRDMTTTARARPTADVVDPLKLSGAVEYFSIIAKAAVEGGIAIDVCCSGASELCLPVFQALVEPSSGYVLPHETFAGPHLKHNMNHFLKETNMTMAACSESQAEKSKSLAPSGCTIDIRMPSFVNPTHLVGPGEILDDFKGLLLNERSAFAAGCKLAARIGMRTNHLPQKDFVDDAVTRLSMGRKDPLSTFSVMLEINNFFQKDAFAFVQCIARFVDRRGQILITRVFSHRISIANDVGEFLDSIDEEVVPVVLGKEAVYRSMYGREIDARNEDETEVATSDELDDLAYDAQKDLDATIHRISVAFRLLGLEQGNRGLDLTEEGGIRTVGSSIDFAFPPELSDALRRLYHLRRGPLLSPGPMRSDDDRAQIRSLFLRLPLEDCLCMCAPSLWRTEVTPECKSDSVEWIAVPPESLALWDKTAIVADCYHSLFIWFGRGVPESFFDSIRQQARTYLLDRSVIRFPMAEIYTVSEGESMDRRFTALLAPSYGDPVDHQVANFPALGQLSPQELESLRCKFRFYDPTSDPSFRTWFWDVASATSSSKEFGLSLCE